MTNRDRRTLQEFCRQCKADGSGAYVVGGAGLGKSPAAWQDAGRAAAGDCSFPALRPVLPGENAGTALIKRYTRLPPYRPKEIRWFDPARGFGAGRPQLSVCLPCGLLIVDVA